jgi:hypothetical protein
MEDLGVTTAMGGSELLEAMARSLQMNIGRSRLALGDRNDALEEAWNIAPQMAWIHPTSQELMRMLSSLHRRSNPLLARLAKGAGIRF